MDCDIDGMLEALIYEASEGAAMIRVLILSPTFASTQDDDRTTLISRRSTPPRLDTAQRASLFRSCGERLVDDREVVSPLVEVSIVHPILGREHGLH